MKELVWDPDKDEWLKANRGLGFVEAAAEIEAGRLLATIAHHDRGKYGHQRIFVVEIRGYACCVPFVETEREIFLKTVYPSRKATRRFLAPWGVSSDEGRA